MRFFLIGLFLLVLLMGCSPSVTNTSAVVIPSNQTDTLKIDERYKDIQSVGLFQPKQINGDLSLGTYYYVKNNNLQDFIHAFSTSKVTTSAKIEVSKDPMSLFLIADASVHLYRYLADEDLIYEDESKTLFSASPELSSLVRKSMQEKSLINTNTLCYKGVPYFGILLAQALNPNDLISIGQVNNTTYFIKKNASQPVELIYYILDKNGFPKGNYMYSAYQIPSTLRSGELDQSKP